MYAHHYNPLLIRNHSWILTIHKAKGHSTWMNLWVKSIQTVIMACVRYIFCENLEVAKVRMLLHNLFRTIIMEKHSTPPLSYYLTAQFNCAKSHQIPQCNIIVLLGTSMYNPINGKVTFFPLHDRKVSWINALFFRLIHIPRYKHKVWGYFSSF